MSLLGLSGEIARFAPDSLRLNFTVEDRKTTEQVLLSFYREFVEGKSVSAPENFTRGHFKRGVE